MTGSVDSAGLRADVVSGVDFVAAHSPWLASIMSTPVAMVDTSVDQWRAAIARGSLGEVCRGLSLMFKYAHEAMLNGSGSDTPDYHEKMGWMESGHQRFAALEVEASVVPPPPARSPLSSRPVEPQEPPLTDPVPFARPAYKTTFAPLYAPKRHPDTVSSYLPPGHEDEPEEAPSPALGSSPSLTRSRDQDPDESE